MQVTVRSFFKATTALAALVLLTATAQAQISAVRINEIMALNSSYPNTDGTITDWVELYNTGATAVNLAGASLTDSNAFPTRFVFKPNTIIPAHGYLVITCDSSRPDSASNAAFGLGASGGYVYLYAPGSYVVPVDSVLYGIQPEDYTIGRVPDGTGAWSLCRPTQRTANAGVPLGPVSTLKINEWMADPDGGDDWFEIANTNANPVALGGLWLSDTNIYPIQYRIPALSFIGAGYARGFTKFIADGNTNAYNADHVNFSLKAGGESITLYNADGVTPIHVVMFTAQEEGVSEGWLPDANLNNRVRFPEDVNGESTATDGRPNSLPLPNLVVNEVLSHTDFPQEDAVEFLNVGATPIDISGWWLSNARYNPKRARIPAGPAIPPGGFRVIYEYQFNTNAADYPPTYPKSNIPDSFTFNSAHGDEVHLFQANAAGNLTGYRVSEVFEAAANGISFGRYNTIGIPGDYKFVAQSRTTFGRDNPFNLQDFRQGTGLANAYPKVGPIVINEVMYRPTNTYWGGLPFPSENPDEEYIELRNITTEYIPLFDPAYPTNRWRFQRGITFVFPPNQVIPPNGYALVVPFDPATNGATLANFRSRFNVPANAQIFGPWGTSRLNNAGDAIELYRPDPVQLPPRPDAGFVPYIRIDKVNYSSAAPWPNADNNGRSLQKKNSLQFGNDPVNWAADFPTAGRPNPSALTDTDGDGMPDTWEDANGFNKNNPNDALLDADNDTMSNLEEYLVGTNPRNAGSKLTVQISYPNTNSPLHLSWLAISNISYTVQYRGNFGDSSWKDLTNVAPATMHRNVQVVDPSPPAGDRYYRLISP